jgi:hypothetical protein
MMIRAIIEELKNGNERIPNMFAALEAKWSELFANIEDMSEDTLAEILSREQHDVEHICGSRNLGKSIMPWSAFAIYIPAKLVTKITARKL